MKTKNTTKTVEPACTLSTKYTAVIYARVSSVGDRQSTERQVKDLSDYALYKQLEVRKVFEEHISGAKKNEERPVLCQTLEYCKKNGISTLLVSELSRMGRNAFEVLASVKELLGSPPSCSLRYRPVRNWNVRISPSVCSQVGSNM